MNLYILKLFGLLAEYPKDKVGVRQKKRLTLTLCPFIPGSPGVPGNPREPCNSKQAIHNSNSYFKISVYIRSPPAGYLLPVGQGFLCLQACQVCHCYPVSQQKRHYHSTSHWQRAQKRQRKPLKITCSNANVYIRPLQICQRVHWGHGDQWGPWERKAIHLRSPRWSKVALPKAAVLFWELWVLWSYTLSRLSRLTRMSGVSLGSLLNDKKHRFGLRCHQITPQIKYAVLCVNLQKVQQVQVGL